MKALKFLFVALALLMVAPTFTSCKDDEDEPGDPQSSSIVGTWVYTEEDFSMTLIFSSGGTFTETYREYYNGSWDSESYNGVYTFDGSTITMCYSDGDIDSFEIFISGNSFFTEDGEIFYKK